jgi:hypothetical protein
MEEESNTQLDYTLARVTSEEAEDVPTTITLNISDNDIFLPHALPRVLPR